MQRRRRHKVSIASADDDQHEGMLGPEHVSPVPGPRVYRSPILIEHRFVSISFIRL